MKKKEFFIMRLGIYLTIIMMALALIGLWKPREVVRIAFRV